MRVEVPDIGDFTDVPVIEIHVAPGDEVAAEDPLVTLESEKATMDVPSPAAGTVKEVLVELEEKVSQGTPLLELETAEAGAGEERPEPQGEGEAGGAAESDEQAGEAQPADAESQETQDIPRKGDSRREEEREGTPARAGGRDREPPGKRLVVIGSGPGGYAAAFRAADLGLEVTLVERYERLGGVCLNVGCIPSKALLHAARVIAEAEEAREFGLSFQDPDIDLDALRKWKDGVVGKLTGGLASLAKQRRVNVVQGTARFKSERALEVDGGEDLDFDQCIIAAGSRAATLPGMPDDERIVDSTRALELGGVPETLLVIGGGIIGLELATVYESLGSRVTVVELTDQLMPGCDHDLVKPLHKRIAERYEDVLLGTKVASVEARDDGVAVSFDGDDAPDARTFERVLVAVGRRANGDRLDLDAAGVEADDAGRIPVDEQRRTNVPHIFAIGDIAGDPMLAHKATHEGHAAAEVAAGRNVAFDPRAIPAVAYTDPEVAWTGLTETDAAASGIEYEKAVFPWQASGRALALARDDGLTKLLVDPRSRRVLGAGIVGPNAGELIAEATLAIEMGADAEDVGLTIHPHPTLSESLGFAAEAAEGTITDLYLPKQRRS